MKCNKLNIFSSLLLVFSFFGCNNNQKLNISLDQDINVSSSSKKYPYKFYNSATESIFKSLKSDFTKQFNKADSDKNNSMSYQEFLKTTFPDFDTTSNKIWGFDLMDKDQNNNLSEEEFLQGVLIAEIRGLQLDLENAVISYRSNISKARYPKFIELLKEDNLFPGEKIFNSEEIFKLSDKNKDGYLKMIRKDNRGGYKDGEYDYFEKFYIVEVLKNYLKK